MAKKKKGNWIVRMKCEVTKDVLVSNCTEDEARKTPWEFATEEIEVEQCDWKVTDVTPND